MPAHLTNYAVEGLLLGGFMVSACVSVAVVEHPASPVRAALGAAGLRRAFVGLLMGLTAVGLILSPLGQRTGAHMNPAVTLAFLALGLIAPVDAAGYTPNNEEAHARLTRKLKSLLQRVGCDDRLIPHHVYLGKKIPLAGVAHQCGTVRFGDDPRTSVLDANCRTHDVENLYVVDAGFFPSSTSLNPALTIMANALRVGDHLLKQPA
jgi:choline dehydrogenase-like flavoprotein